MRLWVILSVLWIGYWTWTSVIAWREAVMSDRRETMLAARASQSDVAYVPGPAIVLQAPLPPGKDPFAAAGFMPVQPQPAPPPPPPSHLYTDACWQDLLAKLPQALLPPLWLLLAGWAALWIRRGFRD